MIHTWVLILTIMTYGHGYNEDHASASVAAVGGFTTEAQCHDAGVKWQDTLLTADLPSHGRDLHVAYLVSCVPQ